MTLSGTVRSVMNPVYTFAAFNNTFYKVNFLPMNRHFSFGLLVLILASMNPTHSHAQGLSTCYST